MISSQKTPVRSAQALFWIGFAVVLSSATGVRSQDVSTGFEFNHLTKEVFTLGDSPKSVTFQGGQATKPFTSELERLVRTGGHSWIIGCKETGKISFETPAAQISFYMYNMGPEVAPGKSDNCLRCIPPTKEGYAMKRRRRVFW